MDSPSGCDFFPSSSYTIGTVNENGIEITFQSIVKATEGNEVPPGHTLEFYMPGGFVLNAGVNIANIQFPNQQSFPIFQHTETFYPESNHTISNTQLNFNVDTFFHYDSNGDAVSLCWNQDFGFNKFYKVNWDLCEEVTFDMDINSNDGTVVDFSFIPKFHNQETFLSSGTYEIIDPSTGAILYSDELFNNNKNFNIDFINNVPAGTTKEFIINASGSVLDCKNYYSEKFYVENPGTTCEDLDFDINYNLEDTNLNITIGGHFNHPVYNTINAYHLNEIILLDSNDAPLYSTTITNFTTSFGDDIQENIDLINYIEGCSEEFKIKINSVISYGNPTLTNITVVCEKETIIENIIYGNENETCEDLDFNAGFTYKTFPLTMNNALLFEPIFENFPSGWEIADIYWKLEPDDSNWFDTEILNIDQTLIPEHSQLIRLIDFPINETLSFRPSMVLTLRNPCNGEVCQYVFDSRLETEENLFESFKIENYLVCEFPEYDVNVEYTPTSSTSGKYSFNLFEELIDDPNETYSIKWTISKLGEHSTVTEEYITYNEPYLIFDNTPIENSYDVTLVKALVRYSGEINTCRQLIYFEHYNPLTNYQIDYSYLQNYIMNQQDLNYFSDFSSFNLNSPQNNGSFMISPNPATDILNISIVNSDMINENSSLELYDFTGYKVKSISNIKEKEFKLDISKLKKGLYLIKMISNNRIIQTEKIIIK